MRQLLRNVGGVDVGAVDLHVGGVEVADGRAEALKNLQKGGHVGNLGDIFDAADAVYQQRGGDDGNGSVLRAADVNLAMERTTAADNVFLHIISLNGNGSKSCKAPV